MVCYIVGTVGDQGNLVSSFRHAKLHEHVADYTWVCNCTSQSRLVRCPGSKCLLAVASCLGPSALEWVKSQDADLANLHAIRASLPHVNLYLVGVS